MGFQDQRQRHGRAGQRAVPIATTSTDDELGALLVAPTGTRDDLATEAAMAALATAEREGFSTAIGHDLKKAILGIAVDAQRLAMEKDVRPEARAYLANIIRTAAEVDRSIQRLLDTALISAGRLELQPTRVDLERLVREALEGLSPVQRARIDLVFGDRMAAMLDPIRFARALAMVAQVAVDRSGPTARVAIRLDGRGADRMRISLMGAELGGFMQELAWAFSTASVTRLHHGVACELRTVRTVIEAHGGEVGFEPDVGGAARFWIEIPAIQLRGMLARRHRRTDRDDDGEVSA